MFSCPSPFQPRSSLQPSTLLPSMSTVSWFHRLRVSHSRSVAMARRWSRSLCLWVAATRTTTWKVVSCISPCCCSDWSCGSLTLHCRCISPGIIRRLFVEFPAFSPILEGGGSSSYSWSSHLRWAQGWSSYGVFRIVRECLQPWELNSVGQVGRSTLVRVWRQSRTRLVWLKSPESGLVVVLLRQSCGSVFPCWWCDTPPECISSQLCRASSACWWFPCSRYSCISETECWSKFCVSSFLL